MTTRQLQADAECCCAENLGRLVPADADLLAEAMRKSSDEPICDQCALAHGAIEPARAIVGMQQTACCVCKTDRLCSGIRDWRWSGDVWARISR